MNLTFIIEFFKDGGPVMFPILLVSFAIWGLIIERILYFRRHGIGSAADAKAIIQSDGQLTTKNLNDGQTDTILVSYVSIAYQKGALRSPEPRNIFSESELTLTPELEARVDWLKTLSTVAPLLGLFGTVTGMITTFNALTTQFSGDPRALSSGVSAALITTEAGLIAALPGLIAATMIQNHVQRVRAMMHQLRTDAVRRIEQTRKGGE